MKTYITSILTAMMLALLATACDSPEVAGDKRLVLDGYIDSGGTPEVILTMSADPAEVSNVRDHIVQWGKVTIYSSTDSVILTGARDKRRFPPYVYYSSLFKGEPGGRYRIRAEYSGMCVESECVMPRPTPIEEVRFKPEATDTSQMQATLTFTAPQDVPAYYRIYTRVMGQDSTWYPSKLGTFAVQTPGERVTRAIYRGEQEIYGPKERALTFPRGSKISIKLCRITPEVFAYYREFDNLSTFGGGVFLTVITPLPTNIRHGYGIWSAQGTSRLLIEAR